MKVAMYPPAARGELILRGPVCMKGYWNKS